MSSFQLNWGNPAVPITAGRQRNAQAPRGSAVVPKAGTRAAPKNTGSGYRPRQPTSQTFTRTWTQVGHISPHDKIETLEMFPGRYPIAPESRDCLFEIRMLIYGDYLILFRINNDVVEVLHFRHGARKQSSSQ